MGPNPVTNLFWTRREKENKNEHTKNYPIKWTIQWKLTLLLGNSSFHIYFTSADIYIQTIIFMLFSTTLHCHYSNKPRSSVLIRIHTHTSPVLFTELTFDYTAFGLGFLCLTFYITVLHFILHFVLFSFFGIFA